MKRWWIAVVLLVLLVAASVYSVRSNVRARKQQEQAARATALRDALASMRKAIAAFHREHRRYPYSLYELVPKYLQRVPPDPVTGATDWRLVTEERVEAGADFTTGAAPKPQPVIVDVKSSAPGFSEY